MWTRQLVRGVIACTAAVIATVTLAATPASAADIWNFNCRVTTPGRYECVTNYFANSPVTVQWIVNRRFYPADWVTTESSRISGYCTMGVSKTIEVLVSDSQGSDSRSTVLNCLET